MSGQDKSASVGMLSCIVCDRNFESAANDPSFDFVPYEGTLFYSHGHYGSTVFDPMDGTQLEVIVCDECLKARWQRVALVHPGRANLGRVPWEEYAPSPNSEVHHG